MKTPILDIEFHAILDRQEDLRVFLAVASQARTDFNRVPENEDEARAIIEENTACCFIVYGEMTVGYVAYRFDEGTPGHPLYLAELAVIPEYQGRGIGGTVIERLFEACRQRGTTRATLHTHPENPARRLYELHGFRTTGNVIEDYHGCGRRDEFAATLQK